MKLQLTLLALALTGIQSGMVLAEDPPHAASVALGYVGTSGNTDTSTLNAELLLALHSDAWLHSIKAQALGSQEDSHTKAESYYLEDKSDYNLDSRQYLFGKGSYLDDRFSGYSYQATATLGYGRYLVQSNDFSLQAFGGAGYRKSAPVIGATKNDGIITVGEKLAWTLSPGSKLVQSFTSDIGGSLTLSTFELGLESQIINRVATKIAFQARNNTSVPAGKKKTDTQTSISLVYSF